MSRQLSEGLDRIGRLNRMYDRFHGRESAWIARQIQSIYLDLGCGSPKRAANDEFEIICDCAVCQHSEWPARRPSVVAVDIDDDWEWRQDCDDLVEPDYYLDDPACRGPEQEIVIPEFDDDDEYNWPGPEDIPF